MTVIELIRWLEAFEDQSLPVVFPERDERCCDNSCREIKSVHLEDAHVSLGKHYDKVVILRED